MRENPFPGMNPYMENPLYWRGHHALLIHSISAELNQVLPQEYSMRIEERVYIEDTNVTVLERTTVDALDAPFILEWTPRRARHRFVAVYKTSFPEELVAVIEVLSPANKEAGLGRDDYQHRQRAVFDSTAHLLEIDLLRAGQRTIPPGDVSRFVAPPYCDYLVSLHKAGMGDRVDYWPALLRSRLPRVGLPLANEDTVVTLDMQSVVNRVYTESGIWRDVRYSDAPDPALRAEDEKWADALLREKGLRS